MFHPRQPCWGRWIQRRLENDERHRQRRSIFGPIAQRGWHLGGEHQPGRDLGRGRHRRQWGRLQFCGHLLEHRRGYTFPTLLVAGTPNDGSATVLLPNVSTGQARIKVKGSNHVFFDISNNNFGIIPGADIDHDLGISNVAGLNPGACESVLDPRRHSFQPRFATCKQFQLVVDCGRWRPVACELDWELEQWRKRGCAVLRG